MNTEAFYRGEVREEMLASDVIALATLKGWTLDDIAVELGVGVSLQLDVCRRCGRFVLHYHRLRGCGCIHCEHGTD